LHKRATRQLQECERLIALEEKLPVILEGKEKPADAAEVLALARLCLRYKRLYGASARFYAEAFETKPELAKNLTTGDRSSAACAAALAARGQGEDAANLENEERTRLRRQAMDWLRADLALCIKRLKGADETFLAFVQQRLERWQREPDLAGLREAAALARLSPDEREAWGALWADVRAFLARIKPTPKESPPK
jgi:hypothetical protein